MAYEAKTKPVETNARAWILSVADQTQRRSAEELLALFEQATGELPVMWGASIIGFGSYAYTYASGHSGISAKVGFAVRKTGLVVYLCPGFEALGDELMRLGPHKTGKGCLYLKSLDGINRASLSQMIANSVAEIDRRYPQV